MEQQVIERFLDKISPEPNTGCWLWNAVLTGTGYGNFMVNRSVYTAHRASFLIHKGPIPDGMQVCHKCDVRCCVNPDHLFLGTSQDNAIDKCNKGRHPNQTKTHCRNGHELPSQPNVTWGKRSFRLCLVCRRESHNRANLNYRIKQRGGVA